jgi:uncharacterized protein YdhG (YjbR/CyaY superfamily)
MDQVDTYLAKFPEDVKEKLLHIRAMIRQLAPQAVEEIAYGIVGYKLNGRPLVYFAGFKKHIGFYATPTGHKEFAAELSQFKQGKGSVQFPLEEPLPIDLIARIIAFRIEENSKRK